MKVQLKLLTLVTAVVAVYSDCVCKGSRLTCEKSNFKDVRQMLLQAPDCPTATVVNIGKSNLGSAQIPREFVRKHNNASFWVSSNDLSSLDWLIGWRGPGLVFHYNTITDVDPKLLGEHLEYVFANANSLVRLDLSAATKLRRIWFDSNGLEEIVYPNPCFLDYIDLENNNFNTVPNSILRCHRLTDINLKRNLLFEIPKSLIQLLLLRPTQWENGDHNLEMKIDLRNNRITSEHVIEVFKRFIREEHKLTIFPFPNCECATLRTADKQYAAVHYCISSMCGDNKYSKWYDI